MNFRWLPFINRLDLALNVILACCCACCCDAIEGLSVMCFDLSFMSSLPVYAALGMEESSQSCLILVKEDTFLERW
jgi:hypothetical protein